MEFHHTFNGGRHVLKVMRPQYGTEPSRLLNGEGHCAKYAAMTLNVRNQSVPSSDKVDQTWAVKRQRSQCNNQF